MRTAKLPRLLLASVLFALYMCSAGAIEAATLSLEPESTFVTTGVGSVIDLDLRVDENTQGIRLFQARIAFDTLMFDTVSTTLGPLFDTSGFTRVFNSYIYYDSTLATTILRLEGLLFGPSAVVDGPGVVAQVQLVALNTGISELPILQHVMTDISNDPIESTAEGAVVIVDFPPDEFDLIWPINETILGFPDSAIQFFWEPSSSIYPGEVVKYRFEISADESFPTGSTLTYLAVSDTTCWVAIDTLTNETTYWWRVTAYGNLYGFERESTPFGASFFLSEPSQPAPFALLSPVGDAEVIGIPGSTIQLQWESSSSIYPSENILYDIDYSTNSDFAAGSTVSTTGYTGTSLSINVDDLTNGRYFWRVLATGDVYGLTRESTPYPDSFEFAIGGDPGSFDLSSPDNGDLVDLVDKTEATFTWQTAPSVIPDDTTWYLVYLWDNAATNPGEEFYLDSIRENTSLTVPENSVPLGVSVYWKVLARNRLGFTTWSTSTNTVTYFWRGDVVINRAIDISDLVFLVSYMFQQGNSPEIMLSADINCSYAGPDISDLVRLVSYMFQQGDPLGCSNE
ncbi:MAG TPA: hypothetical protein PLF13_10880 [candidate division Zixibacteria bacterium]|nr:hypothetical protein [candidate division Zixibacteria bacterium]